ncbi:MAG: hypothetical protein K0R24_1049 [Gammaproteobacteria bacterium]|jgi:hypothetical protein|nr:hypothetical protein [Gammaproteobacteria bacterium]
MRQQVSPSLETAIFGQSFAKNFFKMLTYYVYAALFQQFFAKPCLKTGRFYSIKGVLNLLQNEE